MSNLSAQLSSFLFSAVVATSSTLLLGWPSHVNAVGDAEQSEQQQARLAEQQSAPANASLARNSSKVGDLVVTANLITGEDARGRSLIRLECQNPTDQRIAGQIQVELTRTTGSPTERVMPRPQIAWRRPETVEVAPGQTLVREIALPKNIGAEVARVERARQRAEESETTRYPRVYYGVLAEPVDTATRPSNSKPRNRMSKLSLALPRNQAEFGY